MIKAKVQAKIAKAFNGKAADAVKTFTCTKEISTGDFDFVTQTYPTTMVEAYSGRGVFGNYKKEWVKPTDYQIEDLRLTALQNEVMKDGEPYQPQADDVLDTPYGQLKIVGPINQDPTSAVWVLQLRKVST